MPGRSNIRLISARRLAALVLVCTAALAVAPAAYAGPPGTRNFHRCGTALFTGSGSQTYRGYVYGSPGSVMQYWVRAKNVNVLGWLGSVSAGQHSTNIGLWPYRSAWVYSPAIFPANRYQRRFSYSVGISPTSDASAIALELWAPLCS